MSDIMRPMPFSQLMTWALEEYKTTGSLFGVAKLPRHTDGFFPGEMRREGSVSHFKTYK